MMTKYTFFTLLCGLFVLTSCTNEQKKYYDNGQLKEVYQLKNGKKEGKYIEYYPSGKTRIIHHYNNGIKVDSSIYFKTDGSLQAKDFYANGETKRAYYNKQEFAKIEGKVDSLDRFYGVWNYYNKEGWVDREREFLIIDGETYLNQEKLLDKNGEVIFGEGDYFEFSLKKDTVTIDYASVANVMLVSSKTFLDENLSSQIKVILPKRAAVNFNADFSNIDKVETDTIYNLNIEKGHRKLLGVQNGVDVPNHALIGRYYSEVGNQHFRGIVLEYFNDSNTPDSLKNYERKYYFDIPVYVKDTIE